MKAKLIADLTQAEVAEKLQIEVENYNKMKLNHAVTPLENPVKLRFQRKFIARLKTDLQKREAAKASK